MIVFETLTWKNFLSTGNAPTTIRLNSSPTTLVLGQNGSGKSTMLDALCWVLFKKPFRKIKKNQIVNTINGSNCEVSVQFSIGTNQYTVRRGIDPDYFEIIMPDGNPRLKAAGQKDDQAFLQEDILKVNYTSFTQVVILGNASYTPFMQLEPKDRRAFIEHILDIGVFSSMNKILNTKQTTLATTLADAAKDIEFQKERAKLVQGFIDKLEIERQKAQVDTEKQIREQNEIIDVHMPDIERLTSEIEVENESLTKHTNELNDALAAEIEEHRVACETKRDELEESLVDYSALEDKIRKLVHMKSGIEENAKLTQQNIEFYTNMDTCKTCKQELDENFRVKIVTEKTAALEEFKAGLDKITKEITKNNKKLAEIKASNATIESEIRSLTTGHQTMVRELTAASQAKFRTVTAEMQEHIKKLTTELHSHQTAVSAARQFIKKIEADRANESSANLDEQYKKRDDIIKKGMVLEAKRAEAIETRHFYEIAAVLLKDTGIKAAIIKQYLPMINKLVNKYLTELDFYLLFALDENFNETFKSRHRDTLQYYSFSEGEKLRIDLALLFAWRDIARMKNSCATNLLILDEVIDGSMDHNGTDFFIKMINELGTGSNVFVISHKQDSSLDKFKDVLRFEKVKNFSQLAVSV